MGTTLTGTTPQDTYDSLIKVTDNGPLTGSLKKLTDGLGNDSSLSLSTAAASIAGTLAVTTGTTLATTSGNVGIGVLPSTPVYKLQINASGGNGISLLGDVDNEAFVLFGDSASAVVGRLVYSNIDDSMQMFTNGSEKVRITSAGNVGIGTSAPTALLESVVSSAGASPTVALRLQNTGASYQAKMVLTDSVTNDGNIVYQGGVTGDTQYIGFGVGAAVNDVQVTGSRYLRMAASTGGIQFNGDTAAANALDDYEEGTFTATLKGSVSDPSTPVTTTGTYTKIGRQVTVRGDFVNVNTSGASGEVSVSGLPFAGTGQSVGSVMLYAFDLDTSTAQNSYVGAGSFIEFFGQKDDSAWVNLKHNAGAGRYLNFTITYFV